MPPLLKHRNGILSIDNSELVANAVAESYLTADVAAASGTITVKNIIGFGINQILLIGELGTDSAEIILTHASTVPSGTTVTLVGNTVKAHTTGDKVRVLVYNQFELSRGTTTVAASGTVLTTATTANFNPISAIGSGLVAVDPTTVIQKHESSEHTSGYYFARYKNSITSDFSGYTDALVYGGWDEGTVGYMIERALSDLSLTLSDRITRQSCYAWINEGMKELKGKLKRWPEHYKDNQVIGQTSRGTNIVSMPSDIYDTETNKSITGLRVGTGGKLQYLDPTAFDVYLYDVATTQVTTEGAVAATTLEIDNSYDFADSGSVTVYISGTEYSITYTGVTRSSTAGILTGVPASGTGSISVTIPVDTYVWQGETEGDPYIYTVRNGAINLWPLVDSSHDNMNVYADYNSVATEVNSDGDTIDYQRFDILQAYLTWRAYCKAKLDGKLDQMNGWYMTYKERLNDAIRTLSQGRVFGFSPKINTMKSRGGDKDYGWTTVSEVDPS